MTERKKTHFLRGAVIYGLVLLVLGGIGMGFLWKFLDSYEQSRPKTTLAEYQEQLTPEYVCAQALWLRDSLTPGIQTEEEFRRVVSDTIQGGVTFARKSRECTADRMVYAMRSGAYVVGEVVIAAGEPDFFGMTPWTVTEEKFDFTPLKQELAPVTVPETYQVSVNGHLLDESFLTGETVPYPELKDFSEAYDLPCRVVYAPGALLGEAEVQILDEAGSPVTLQEDMDWSFLYDNCTGQEKEMLEEFTEDFLLRYIAFTGSNKNNKTYNHAMLSRYVLPEGDLKRRVWVALDGLTYGSSVRDELVSVSTNFQTRMAEDIYLCDVTYEVDTTGRKGVVRTTTNARIVIWDTEDGLQVESMNIY